MHHSGYQMVTILVRIVHQEHNVQEGRTIFYWMDGGLIQIILFQENVPIRYCILFCVQICDDYRLLVLVVIRLLTVPRDILECFALSVSQDGMNWVICVLVRCCNLWNRYLVWFYDRMPRRHEFVQVYYRSRYPCTDSCSHYSVIASCRQNIASCKIGYSCELDSVHRFAEWCAI